MTIRRSKMSRKLSLNPQGQDRSLDRVSSKRLLLERLEDRRLLAVGPQLVGIQPNDGSLLNNNDQRDVAPRDLTFLFNSLAAIDPATLPTNVNSPDRFDSIQILRSGFDGTFERASTTTDFNTKGQVVVEFVAKQAGQGGGFVTFTFVKSDLGTSSRNPVVDVVGKNIHVTLNNRTGSETRARELVDSVNAHPRANLLVSARIQSGFATANIAEPVINYSPLPLGPANAAKATSNFNASPTLQIKFTATQPGVAQNGIKIFVDKQDLGLGAGPRISVAGKDISITLNVNVNNRTTAQQLVTAVNNNAAARALVTASITTGDRDTVIAGPVINFSPLVLGGANDIRIEPGYLNLGDSPREIIARFKETLVDDVYMIDIFGSGPRPLADVDGNAFNDGQDFQRQFELDLGAQVVAVVPQPITRNATTGQLSQARDTIVVYFNNDDLDPATAQDPRFYQLIFTGRDNGRNNNGTVENTDDIRFHPSTITYDAATDMAVLKFARNLDDLRNPATGLPVGASTFRLRIGTDETAPLKPRAVDITNDPGSSFFTALNLDGTGNWDTGAQIVVKGGGDRFTEGQTFTIRNKQDVPQLFEFDSGFTLQVPAAGGGAGGVVDGERFTIDNGTTLTTFEFDSNNNVPVGNVRVPFTVGDSASVLANTLVTVITNANIGLTPVNLGTGRVHLGGTTSHVLNTSNSKLTQSGQPGAQTAGAIPVRFVPDASFTATNVAASITAAVNTSALGLSAIQDGSRVRVAGDLRISLPLSLTGLELANEGVILSSQIVNEDPYLLDFPGASNEPGHRDIRPEVESHLLGGADSTSGITTFFYNFKDEYGIVDGQVVHNGITEVQKQRAREIFELYSGYLGVNFIESANRGFTIVTGDLRAVDPTVPTGPGGVLGIAGNNTAIMDLADFSNPGDDRFGGPWFQTAMHEIGHLLGQGHTYDLPPITIQGDDIRLTFGQGTEPVFPGDQDIAHGQHLYRPESKDIDLYRFELNETGLFTAETNAERGVLENASLETSLLDTVLTLYKADLDAQGRVIARQLISRNDDYFSKDSYIEVELGPGVYYVGVSASGNDQYDPAVEDSGIGGRTQGKYDLRLNFRPDADRTILDTTGKPFDGNADGLVGGVFNFWFRAAPPLGQEAPGTPRTIFVDKAAPLGGNGSLAAPFRNINQATAAARADDIVRIVGNAGADGNVTTLADNLAYEVGFSRIGNAPLADGSTLEIPKGVTVMVDANAIIKLRRARVGAGSSSLGIDRSGGSLQVLGAPRLLDNLGRVIKDETGQPIQASVFFTSAHDLTIGKGVNPDQTPPAAKPGDWGGLVFQYDVDAAAQRFIYEDEGIFLNNVNHADMRFGGGSLLINGVTQVIAPIHMIDARPTVTHNKITRSSDAAMSANPDSFKESNFHSPRRQIRTIHTQDYARVGPEVHHNTTINNSINGLFIRIDTPAGQQLETMTVSGRWDDTDIAHIVSENLVIEGTPGGPVELAIAPPVNVVRLAPRNGGTLPAGTYNYRIVFVDSQGVEGPASDITRSLTIGGATGSIFLDNLPTLRNFPSFVSRRIYRSDDNGGGRYTLAAEINALSTTYLDNGATIGGELIPAPAKLQPRLDARLRIDGGTVVKLDRSRIDTQFGSSLIAEGTDGLEVIFTSLQDVRYGGSGTFDTSAQGGQSAPMPGDWAGLFLAHLSDNSLDHVVVAFGGGVTRVEGSFAGFNPIEIHQSDTRITNTRLEDNANGIGGQAPSHRFGRGFNDEAAIFVRGAQPVIVSNSFLRNGGAAININANALNHLGVTDLGRSTGEVEIMSKSLDNQGPLIRGNRIDDTDINALVVRGGSLTTQGVWDDTDIVHVLLDTVIVPDFHTYGGLRLESSATESLVVKLEGNTAGFTATGRPLEIADRVGGSVQVVGQPRFPVVMTSLRDCTVGAGFTPDGTPQTDTINSGLCSDEEVDVPFADVIVVMDESASMGFAQQFSVGLIADLDQALINAGIGDGDPGINLFGLVGYGGAPPEELGHAHPVGPMGALFGTSAEYAQAAAGLQTNGVTEDGYEAINFMLNTYTFRPNAARFVILVTNEDRDIVDANLTYQTTLAGLNSVNAKLQGIVSATFQDAQGNSALALDMDDNAYLADGQGGFTISPGGSIVFASGTTEADYIDMIHDTGGLAGDINQIQQGGLTATSFANALITSIVTQVGVNPATPADWRSVRIDQFANDRNVEIAVERESADLDTGPDSNQDPENAQFLGGLAPHLKAGDDNLRLGFEVHGTLSKPGDVDVYSFTGIAGSEVWLDIDRTTHSLDTVIELVDVDGNIIAQSNDSFSEEIGTSAIFTDGLRLLPNQVFPLRKSTAAFYPESAFGQPKDQFTTNPRDAGFRLILPGSLGTAATYHVRVRSNNRLPGDPAAKLQDLSKLNDGLTAGTYQLQIRLREQDEVPGSTVQFSDIRFATNAIEVFGQPTHSPLLGEAIEDTTNNNTFGSSQQLGSLNNTDRGALGIAGNLPLLDDIDFYGFDVGHDAVALPPGGHVTTSFDVDYADGLARPNTRLSVYDQNGNLVLVGSSSNHADDQPAPLRGTNVDDLLRGSVGVLDPFIGPVELPPGNYSVAVHSEARVPQEFDQYYIANPTNPLFRLEPVNSVQRIVDERIEGDNLGIPFGSTFKDPQFPVFIDDQSTVPFHLGDVVLFLAEPISFNPPRTRIHTVDPFTGAIETEVGICNAFIGDIAMRQDRQLFSLTLGNNDANTGNYIYIDAGNAACGPTDKDGNALLDDGIQTWQLNPPAGEVISNNGNGFGKQFQAITYGDPNVFGNLSLFAVGNSPVRLGVPAPNPFNVLYQLNRNTGVASSAPAPDRTGCPPGGNECRFLGAGTQIRERGILITDADPNNLANTILIAEEATDVNTRTGVTTPLINDGAQIQVGGQTFEFNSGPEVRLTPNGAQGRFVRDGDTFTLDGAPIEFDTGSVIVVTAVNGSQVVDGQRLTITDNATPAVTRVYEFEKGGGVAPGNVAIVINNGMNAVSLANAIVNTINADAATSLTAERLGTTARVTLRNESFVTGAVSTAPFVQVQGAPGGLGGPVIRVEETSDVAEFAAAIRQAFAALPVDAGVDGNRVNFSGAVQGDFSQIVNRGVFVDVGSNGLVTPGAVPIPFLAQDTDTDIAIRISNTLLSRGIPNSQTDEVVQVQNPTKFTFASPPFRIAGAAPGGSVTGLAFIGNTMYAVSDAGGLYIVQNPSATQGATLNFITSSAPDLQGIRFSGLQAGPDTVENGKYANMLFGITDGGDIYAFDTLGRLQPVFNDGRSMISTGIPGISGFAYSTLDRNLWHITGRRNLDPGHGVDVTFDGSRLIRTEGNNSVWFGRSVDPQNGPHDFDEPGGAHGTLETRPFSLEGYAPEDRPVLYFNYFAQTEGQSTAPNTGPMRDSFRVFVGTEDGTWDILATNNSYPLDSDELASPVNPVQEVFDNVGSWRQVRVPLDQYAGQGNLRLRFDFSTAGSMNVGDPNTVGQELRTIEAKRLRDGETFTIDNTTFEIDLGYTLVAPSGKDIADGSTFRIDFGGGASLTFEFDNNNSVTAPNVPVPFTAVLNAKEVADNMNAAIRNAFNPPTLGGDLTDEGNDILPDALDSQIDGTDAVFRSSGFIGDNPNVSGAVDVDLIRMDLKIGSSITVDVDARDFGSPLDPALRLFDANGVQLAANDNNLGFDPLLTFTAPLAGTYYVGVSGSPNLNYNPRRAGSGTPSTSMGDYDITITVVDPAGETQINGNRIQLPSANLAKADANSRVIIDGAKGATGVPVVLHAGMTDVQVAQIVRQALADQFANGEVETVKTFNNVLRVIEHNITAPGSFGATYSLPGDSDGAFFENLRGQNNAFEGVYIDDIIIGFAERGEMATNPNGNNAFIPNPELPPNQILVGPYQLEVRPSQPFGQTGPNLITPPIPPYMVELDRTIDTNDRESKTTTLFAPSADLISDGQTFTLGDGTNQVTFEFDDVNVNDGVTPGHIRIGFNPSQLDAQGGISPQPANVMAAIIRDAINGPDAQAVIKITAALSDGGVNNTTSDTKINLHGTADTELINASLNVTSTTSDGNALRNSLLGNTFRPVGDAVFSGGAASAGFFDGGFPSIGIERGIILSTGDVRSAEGPNTDDGTTGFASLQGDADLDLTFATTTEDTTTLEFSFETTQAGDLFFDFVFASEEYNEFVNSVFNDVFAFYINGENIGVIPGTSVPVSINTINGGNPFGSGGPNEQFYNNNDMDDGGQFLAQLGYDGFTDVFTARKTNLPAGIHTIKLAISDVGDTALDSAVFIRAFNSAAPDNRNSLPGVKYNAKGDQSRDREQGQIIIQANQIRNAAGFGILVDAGQRTGPEGNPHAGPARVTRELNNNNIVTGVTVTNNVISRSRQGGIHFSGITNAPGQQVGSVPFGRILNNTVVGTGSNDVGIRVSDNASPTLLNNIVADTTVGLEIDATSQTSVVGGMLFAGNTTNAVGTGLGTFPIVLQTSDSLFVNKAERNYYLAAGAAAIDASIDSLQDRPEMITLRQPLGYAPSPILAPDFDVTGQRRVDDPSVASPSGLGRDVFKDRGAIDRADFAGPSAVLISPRDNDAAGLDEDSRPTIVEINSSILKEFSIQLIDGIQPSNQSDGTGADDNTVVSRAVLVTRDNVPLTPGLDYKFSYNATSNIIRLTPLAGIWAPDHAYGIDLLNRDVFIIDTLDGDQYVDGEAFSLTDESANTVTFEFESGFNIQVPAGGGSTLRDGMSFSITFGTKTVRFEFDTNNITLPNAIKIPFTAADSQDQIANAIVNAIKTGNVVLQPRNFGDGLVNLGGTINHTLDVSNSALTQFGTPGVGTNNVPVAFVPHASFDEIQVAASIATAVNGSSLVDVTATTRLGEVVVDGVSAVTGITNEFVRAIKDLAGNDLQPNRFSGQSAFTIFLGSGLDYGDAPDPTYPTLKASNGARHEIVDGFFLGNTADSDVDGQQSSQADGDGADEDGVIFGNALVAGYNTSITVTATGIVGGRDGFLDAWIDFNRDGDWDDAGEKIANRLQLAEGDNAVLFKVPGTAAVGPTFARFRLSSAGGLAPTGQASDGEVEDYQISISPNPWQNQANPLDVNRDGSVSPIDALLIINFLNFNPGASQSPLPVPPAPPFVPPPFLDVSGDGFASPVDALLVINFLNQNVGGEGEAGFARLVSPALDDTPLVDNGLQLTLDAGPSQQMDRDFRRRQEDQATRSSDNTASTFDAARVGTAEAGSSDAFAYTDYESMELDELLNDIAHDVDEGLSDGDRLDDFFGQLGA